MYHFPDSTGDTQTFVPSTKCVKYTRKKISTVFQDLALNIPCGSDGKESACSARDSGLIPGWGRSLRRKWQPTPVFLPGESHGQRSLVGYSLWGCKGLNTTERLTHTHTHTHTHLVELTLSPLYLLRFLLGKQCSCLYISIFFKSCFSYLFMAHHAACGILVP